MLFANTLMGKKSRGKRFGTNLKVTKEAKDSDVDDVDPNDENFFYDEIDQFHANKEKILLKDEGLSDDDQVESEEEEVLGIGSDHDPEEEEDVLVESEEEEDGKGSKAWGRTKSLFYGVDTHEKLEGSDREEAEREEEEEVLAIQKRLAEQIDEEDWGLDLLQTVKEPKDIQLEKDSLKSHVIADFSSLSRKAQWKLAKKESPELEGLIEDFKAKISELETEISPLMKLIRSGKIPKGYGSDFVHLKYRVYIAYLLNISFYLILKTSKTPVQNHPVISRLVQFRTVINRLAPLDQKLRPEIEELLNDNPDSYSAASPESAASNDDTPKETIFDSDHDSNESESSIEMPKLPAAKKAKKRHYVEESKEEPKAKDFSKSMSEKLFNEEKTTEEPSTNSGNEEEENDERRAINYKIAKNKGLKQKRKKIDRNPRVKMREKYRKAKIRRRGQVREYRPEIKKYSGEASGIRIGLKKSVTLQ